MHAPPADALCACARSISRVEYRERERAGMRMMMWLWSSGARRVREKRARVRREEEPARDITRLRCVVGSGMRRFLLLRKKVEYEWMMCVVAFCRLTTKGKIDGIIHT